MPSDEALKLARELGSAGLLSPGASIPPVAEIIDRHTKPHANVAARSRYAVHAHGYSDCNCEVTVPAALLVEAAEELDPLKAASLSLDHGKKINDLVARLRKAAEEIK